MSPWLVRRARYFAPLGVAGAIALGAWVPTLSASPAPGLPPVTAQQLLVDVQQARPPELSGTLTWTANLGVPDLSSLQSASGQGGNQGFDPLSLLSGTRSFSVWLDGARAEHLSLTQDQPAAELDLVRNGSRAWIWDSTTQTVTELQGLPVGGAPTSTTPTTVPAMSPSQLAAQFLDHLSRTTKVTVGTPLYVAGQPAYPLLLAPNGSSASTVDHVEVYVGGAEPLVGVPLGVAVYARGQAAPALSLAFSGQLTLGPPPASELTFTPPPGARVVTRTLSPTSPATGSSSASSSQAGAGLGLGGLSRSGQGWASVVSGVARQFTGAGQATLDQVTTVVPVAGQQARLFSTDLLNVLFMPDGRFYAGFVVPRALEAAASAAA